MPMSPCVVCNVAAVVLQEIAVNTWSSQTQSGTFLVCFVQIKTDLPDQPTVATTIDWSGMSAMTCRGWSHYDSHSNDANKPHE